MLVLDVFVQCRQLQVCRTVTLYTEDMWTEDLCRSVTVGRICAVQVCRADRRSVGRICAVQVCRTVTLSTEDLCTEDLCRSFTVGRICAVQVCRADRRSV